MFHFNWVKTKGRVIASRVRSTFRGSRQVGGSAAALPLHDYVIEIQTPKGATARLEVEQHIETIDVAVGSEVPLLVSPDGTKAIFDSKDPSINVEAVAKANELAEQERFRNQTKQ